MSHFPQAAAFSILAMTITVALRKPRIWRVQLSHAESAVLGAVLIVALDIVPLPLARKTLQFLAAPVITIISLMVITLVAEEAGLFSQLARRIACAADGNPRKLFAYIFLAGTVTGAIFTNDAAVLIFTPLVFHLIEEAQYDDWTPRHKVPFYFAVLYVANVAGVLVISNPINIVAAKLFRISFAEYAAWMVLPAIASILVSYGGLKLVFALHLPARFQPLGPTRVDPRQRRVMIACAVVLLVTLLLLAGESWSGVPPWAVTLAAAVILLSLHCLTTRTGPIRPLRRVGWDVIAFIVGIYIIAVGLRNSVRGGSAARRRRRARRARRSVRTPRPPGERRRAWWWPVRGRRRPLRAGPAGPRRGGR